MQKTGRRQTILCAWRGVADLFFSDLAICYSFMHCAELMQSCVGFFQLLEPVIDCNMKIALEKIWWCWWLMFDACCMWQVSMQQLYAIWKEAQVMFALKWRSFFWNEKIYWNWRWKDWYNRFNRGITKCWWFHLNLHVIDLKCLW